MINFDFLGLKMSKTKKTIPKNKRKELGLGNRQIKSPTLKDIALATNLTIATVSRVLNGVKTSTFSSKTRERVESVAKSLNYRPNLMVRGMRDGRSRNIGMIIRSESQWGAKIIAGAHDTMIPRGYAPFVMNTASERLTETDLLHHLMDRRVDGLIISPRLEPIIDEYLSEIRRLHVPFVVVVREVPNALADFVGLDDYRGGQLAAQHLLALGHRRLAHIGGPQNIRSGRLRAAGFCDVVAKQKNASVELCWMPSFKEEIPLMEKFLYSNQKITAISCATDTIAFGVYSIVSKMGKVIPRDLSIVGFDNLPACEWVNPKLTSIKPDNYSIGRIAAELLLNKIELDGAVKKPTEYLTGVELVLRSSTSVLT